MNKTKFSVAILYKLKDGTEKSYLYKPQQLTLNIVFQEDSFLAYKKAQFIDSKRNDFNDYQIVSKIIKEVPEK